MNRIRLVFLVIVFALNLNFAFSEELTPAGYIVYQDEYGIPSVVAIPPQNKVELEAELGEWSNKFTIILHPDSKLNLSNIVLEQRKINCLTIPNEGPHLDFYHWKTQTGNWKKMKNISYNKWSSISFGNDDFPMLPNFSLNDLESEVKRLRSEDPESLAIWLPLAQDCYQNMTSCYVECGTEIRFFDKSTAKKIPLKTIYIKVPMGC